MFTLMYFFQIPLVNYILVIDLRISKAKRVPIVLTLKNKNIYKLNLKNGMDTLQKSTIHVMRNSLSLVVREVQIKSTKILPYIHQNG